MSSRLDRLLLLLDTGTTPAIRDTAARQIAQIAAKSVAKDAGADILVKDLPPGAEVWQGTTSEWADVMAVVAKIIPFFHSKSFDTRNAATSALLHICQMTPLWTPHYDESCSSIEVPSFSPEFPPFSVSQLLQTGTLLLSSSGKEFSEQVALGTPAEVARARKEAMSRIGLGFMDGVDEDGLVDDLDKELVNDHEDEDHDMKAEQTSSPAPTNGHASVKSEDEDMKDAIIPSRGSKLAIETSVKAEDPSPEDASASPSADSPVDLSGLSARERNRLKRKRKPGNSAFVSAVPISKPNNGAPAAKVRVLNSENGPRAQPVPPASPRPPGPAPEKVIIDPRKGGQVEAKEKAGQALALAVKEGVWVWDGVVSVLQIDLFSPNWEIRHGAALALREVIKVQGASGGMKDGSTREENYILHEKWCNDLAAKFLCLFVLDRFGDFVSDQVVAPVRETVSQTLAALLLHMPRRAILHVHDALLQMIHINSVPPTKPKNGSKKKGVKDKGHVWEVRHAGLVGIKYEVAVRGDLVEDEAGAEVLKGVVDAAVLGLCDDDDDVRSVAATCLTPVAKYLVQRLPGEVDRVLLNLWDCLANMKDDLSSSVGACMDLLGKLVSFELVISSLAGSQVSRPLATLIPSLFPFFRHTIPNVRLAVVNTLYTFLTVPNFPDDWISPNLLQLLFQNLIVEERSDVRDVSLRAWRAAIITCSKSEKRLLESVLPLLRDWFTILMTPFGARIDATLFYTHSRAGMEEAHNVDKSMINQDLSLVTTETILRGRVAASKALAILIHVWPEPDRNEAFAMLLLFYMDSSSMIQQYLAATIVQEWAAESDATSTITPPPSLASTSDLASKMLELFFAYLSKDRPVSYYEMHFVLSRIYQECKALLATFTTDFKVPAAKIPQLPSVIDTNGNVEGAFTIGTAHEVVKGMFDSLKLGLGKTKKKELAALEEKRNKVVFSLEQYSSVKEQHDAQVAAAVAGALIALREMPEKLNPVIRSAMNGVKFEENVDLQMRAARSIAAFAAFYGPAHPDRPNPTEKIVKNLCTFICQDVTFTPVFADHRTVRDGILLVKKSSLGAATGKGKDKEKDSRATTPVEEETPAVIKAKLVRRGAQLALSEMAAKFGSALFDTLPMLWSCMVQSLLDNFSQGSPNDADDRMGKSGESLGQNVIDSLTIFQATIPTLDPSFQPRIAGVFGPVFTALRSRFALVRQCAAQCIATMCSVVTIDVMRLVVEQVIPLLGDATVVGNKQGAMEVIYNVVQLLDDKALPYVIFMIVPVLGRMSDPDDDLRFLATNTFASLVKMVPLEAGLPDPPGFSPELLVKRETERKFLTQLLDGSKVEPYEIPIKVNAELRKYQQEGINWLAFLAKYQLHGILCDDMGLGKTLQSICILASKHHERSERYKATKSPDSVHLPSLIVCPPTLSGHWYHEILKYTENLKPLMYVGAAKDRARLASTLNKFDVIITSYDVVRNDVTALSKHHWHYCILDEGHIIKNAKAKLTKAVKSIQAHHRLILSGTPIQNNVLELWSLFDFLMPGFLGTESFFNEKFGKPISSSRDNKASPKIRDAASTALEALHKQVLPFLLRRLKEDVLNDLPPKIIQDYYCDLSDLQKQIYDSYSSSQAAASAETAVQKENGEATGGQKHVFQSLQYLRKVCNHPALVLKDAESIEAFLPDGNIKDITHAPKLEALRQLLNDCGVGSAPTDTAPVPDARETLSPEAAISQHRVLIFCQMKQMLDIIETDLFKALMPTVTYMRLDGTTDPNKRHAIVQTFNADPSIDCLLLTTHVGGLGLTLTGADTVIFVEHDWNPMKDLQAMDRAHRLGQKKVVNVYRLITKGTLEEKIMGLQRFKLNIANSVITQQNSGLASMDTDLVLDLFKRTTEEEDAAAKKKKDTSGVATQKSVLEGLEDLPPEEEYQFDLPSFLGTLGK